MGAAGGGEGMLMESGPSFEDETLEDHSAVLRYCLSTLFQLVSFFFFFYVDQQHEG